MECKFCSFMYIFLSVKALLSKIIPLLQKAIIIFSDYEIMSRM